MSAQDWPSDNAHYLSIAVEWLRLRLMRLAQPQEVAKIVQRRPLLARIRSRAPKVR
jgi:hypothetical protein